MAPLVVPDDFDDLLAECPEKADELLALAALLVPGFAEPPMSFCTPYRQKSR